MHPYKPSGSPLDLSVCSVLASVFEYMLLTAIQTAPRGWQQHAHNVRDGRFKSRGRRAPGSEVGGHLNHPRQMVMYFLFQRSPRIKLSHIPELPVSVSNPLFLLMSIFMTNWTLSLATVLKSFLLLGLLWESSTSVLYLPYNNLSNARRQLNHPSSSPSKLNSSDPTEPSLRTWSLLLTSLWLIFAGLSPESPQSLPNAKTKIECSTNAK